MKVNEVLAPDRQLRNERKVVMALTEVIPWEFRRVHDSVPYFAAHNPAADLHDSYILVLTRERKTVVRMVDPNVHNSTIIKFAGDSEWTKEVQQFLRKHEGTLWKITSVRPYHSIKMIEFFLEVI
jgi:hypothetical protein